MATKLAPAQKFAGNPDGSVMLLYHVVVVLLPPLLQGYVAPAYVPGKYPPFT